MKNEPTNVALIVCQNYTALRHVNGVNVWNRLKVILNTNIIV